MAEGQLELVWVKNSSGELRGFHPACAEWLNLKSGSETRDPYHTELCRGCGRFLDAMPPEHTGPPPADVEVLLA